MAKYQFKEEFVPARIEEFCEYLEDIKNNANNTIVSYKLDLIILYKYMEMKKDNIDYDDTTGRGITDEDLNNITLDELHSYISFLKRRLGNASSTIGRKIVSVQMFYKYLHSKRKIISNNPTIDLEKPKLAKKQPKHLNRNECDVLIQSITGRNADRDRLMLQMFLGSGLRLAELCSIKIDDIRHDEIVIMGKGSKEREVYLNDECLRLLEIYKPIRTDLISRAISRGVKDVDTETLFISERGQGIARRTVQGTVTNRLKAAGLGKKGYSTHKLRHSAATLLHQSGVDILLIKEILGHESVATTQVYTHASKRQIKDAVKSNPLKR